MNKKEYLNYINNSNKPFIIYKTNKGFDLFTDFSKKIILNNQNIKKFLNRKYSSKKKFKSNVDIYDPLVNIKDVKKEYRIRMISSIKDNRERLPEDGS